MNPKTILTNIPRILSILIASLFLASCYSIFDPAPYNPQFDSDFVENHPNVVQFTTLSNAVTQLNILAIAYAEKGASLMRQQLSLDIPLFGLAAATVVSGIYGGSKDLTLGLGLGSAGFAGTKLYFNPQARAAAYNGAALALSCGASVANQLNTVTTTKEDPLGTANTLQNLIDAASNSKDQNVASLVSAGQKALNDLITAIGIIYRAPARSDPVEVILDIDSEAPPETRAQLMRCRSIGYGHTGCRITLQGRAGDCHITNGLGTLHRDGVCLVVSGYSNPIDLDNNSVTPEGIAAKTRKDEARNRAIHFFNAIKQDCDGNAYMWKARPELPQGITQQQACIHSIDAFIAARDAVPDMTQKDLDLIMYGSCMICSKIDLAHARKKTPAASH